MILDWQLQLGGALDRRQMPSCICLLVALLDRIYLPMRPNPSDHRRISRWRANANFLLLLLLLFPAKQQLLRSNYNNNNR